MGCHITQVDTSVYIAFRYYPIPFHCRMVCSRRYVTLHPLFSLTTTQLIGLSEEELSLTIYWLLWRLSMGQLLSKGLPCIVDLNEKQICMFMSILSVAFIILAYIIMENCSHVLMTRPKISSAIKQIGQVLNYARKHKIPEGRSALTYWEEHYPSCIDLG